MAASFDVFIELLPRLGCANVAVIGDDVDVEDVKVHDDIVMVGDRRIIFPDKFKLDNLVTGLIRGDNNLTFRLKFLHNDKLPDVIDGVTRNLYKKEKINYSKPNVQCGFENRILCRCGALLGFLTPGRLLELPSLGWRSNSLDWFCCVNKLSQPPKVEPQQDDVLYNAFSVVIHSSHVSDDSVTISICEIQQSVVTSTHECEKRKKVETECIKIVHCSICHQDLGTSIDGFIHFWNYAVTFSREKDTLPVAKSILNPQDCFIAIIRSHISDIFTSNMLKFVILNRNNEGTLFWVMDKNITMLESVKGASLDEMKYIKILFKELNSDCGTIPDQNNLETINISNEIYDEGLKFLTESTSLLPESFQTANSFSIAYLKK